MNLITYERNKSWNALASILGSLAFFFKMMESQLRILYKKVIIKVFMFKNN